MSKIDNHSTSLNNDAKNVSHLSELKLIFLGEYFNIHTFQKHPITHNFILREAASLKEWAELDTSMLIQDFYDVRGYDPKVYYRFVDDNEEFAHAHKYAMRRIGSRRELGVVVRKFEVTTIQKTLGHYQDIWREEVRLANAARLEVAEKASNTFVVIEKFPSPLDDVVCTTSKTPEEIAANIHRNTATDRQVKVNSNVGV